MNRDNGQIRHSFVSNIAILSRSIAMLNDRLLEQIATDAGKLQFQLQIQKYIYRPIQ
jgi:Tfp pilus assembly protein PilO